MPTVSPSNASTIDFPHIFDHFVSATGARFRSSEPRVDVHEADNLTTFLLNLPGVPREGLDITVHEGTLAVSGSWGSPYGDWTKVEVEERPKGPFRRVFRVPKTLTAAQIKAKMEDGVLRIEFERMPGAAHEGEKVPVA
ncbi:hypothetical protein RQP46_010084 [Phenoliferia psychrophenolica]